MGFLLYHLLDESAGKYPERKAIVYKNDSITYRELAQASNKLANSLAETGVNRGDRVGIYLSKSISSVVSIFGILKAGGTYVPIAPDAPPKRAEYIIRNCGIKHLLSTADKVSRLEGMFPEGCPIEKIILTDSGQTESQLASEIISWETIKNSEGEHPPSLNVIDRDLAYILYTSGSTGDPKGVMISHLNSLTFVNWAQDFFRINKEDRVANHSPLHFDLSVFDIFATVKAGGTVVVIPDGAATFPVRLAELIAREGITVWNSVPSVLILLVTHGKLERLDFSSLRLVLFAGEIFPVKYLRQLKGYIPHADYYNQYGQTEANSSTYYHVKELPHNDGKIPIGKTAVNFEVFAIDENNNIITQPGEVGELYVHGSSVARGYWGNSEKTRLAFVDNPLSNGAGEKVYRTGDLVTLDENGDYVFLCRKDNMVKSRGYRIELGEIETAISGYQGVKAVAAVAVPDDLIGNVIKAIIVPVAPGALTVTEVERYCSEILPRYMIPEMIEFCDSLPMTSTGKIDRQALITPSTTST
jgi:amino acid adenylation domain-containing protein